MNYGNNIPQLAATTPIHPDVLKEMLPYFNDAFGNPSTIYSYGKEAKLKVVTGDINNKDIQKHILEIFEGDRDALLEKSRKLGRILE